MSNTYVITDYSVIPNVSELQTEKIQAVLDMCKNGGGTVVIPAGTYRVAALWMWSDTTLYLQSGATLLGSDECDDYQVFSVTAGVDMRSDEEMIPEYFNQYGWDEVRRGAYRRAVISSYGQRNIAIIGEPGSLINGSNCFDPEGEEHYRGPHAIFLSSCENVTLRGYTVAHSGNFLHEANNCRNLVMDNVTCLGGSDGIHLHCSSNIRIENCDMKTGDDCIAGINVQDLTVRNCKLNTSCSPFRIGGIHIRVEDCHIYGPGIYPHRMTVVKGKHDELPQEAGRHNTVGLMEYFASKAHPDVENCHDFVFRNCVIEGIDRLLLFRTGSYIQTGNDLTEWVFDNVTFRRVAGPSVTSANPQAPFYVRIRNVTVEDGSFADLMDKTDPNTHIVEF